MNRILVAKDKIESNHSDISVEGNTFIIKKDMKVLIQFDDCKEDYSFIIKKKVKASIIELFHNSNIKQSYQVLDEANLKVFSYGQDVSGEVISLLDGKRANFDYHFSGINEKEEEWKVEVAHNSSHTTSNVFQHIITLSGSTVLDITGIVPKESEGCTCNQDNQMIHFGESECIILPKLLIDHYDCFANHSAYVGDFSKEEVFYLQSRGLTRKEANELLMKSFLFGTMELEEEEKSLFYQQIENVEV